MASLPSGSVDLTPEVLAEQVEQALHTHTLSAWFPRCIDAVEGGFHQDFSRDWTRGGRQPRSVVFQARMTWAVATIARRRPAIAPALAGLVAHGMNCLQATFWDRQAGGLMFYEGQPASKHSYGVAFGLVAAAAAYRQCGSADHLAFATQLFDWWDSHLHDGKCSGYFETLDRYGQPATCARGPASPGERDCIGTPYGLRSSNTLIHAVEALTEFYLASEGEAVRARLEESVDLLERLVTRGSQRLYRYFDADWSPVDRARSYGHDVETCFLVARARRALGWAGHSPIRRLGENALSRGYDRRYGGLYSGQRRGSCGRDRAKIWWVQAELLNYLASELNAATPGSTRVLQRIRQTWRFIAECQLDAQHSGWFDTLSRDGARVLRADKGGPWKAVYHEVRALLNAADALRSLDTASGP
ncbi:MAG: hypothetical protein EHM68_04105 [Lysobacterales bacterium]|nr:MAG: hypothetical protein EHM68_04105 [Xanthomonadales bacterium]